MLTVSDYGLKRLFVILFSLMACLLGHSASSDEDMLVNLRLSDGLSGETVYHVITDHSGHIWMATSNGVSAYNGKRITQFSLSDAAHPTVIVNALCEVSGKMIIAAAETGLYRLRKGEEQFVRILPEIQNPIALLAVGDTLYIGGQQGLQVYDGRQLKTFNVGAVHKGLDNIVRHFVRDDDGRILFLGRYGVFSFDPRTESISRVTTDEELPDRMGMTQFEKVGDRLFLGAMFRGVMVFDLKTRTLEHLSGVGNVVRTVRKSNDGYICVATDGAGAFLIDPQSLKIVETYNTSENSTCQLPSNALYSYYRDAGGVNWFGFVRYGLSYTYHSGRLFRPFMPGGFQTDRLNVRSFCRHGETCVIGTQDGLWFVDTLRQIRRYISAEELGGGHIVNALAWMGGEYYVGTYDGGLRMLDPRSVSIRKLRSTQLLDSTTIGDVKEGPDGRLWIGSGEGLFVIDKEGGVTRYTEQNSHIVGGLIISITFDRRGNGWLTGASGVSLYSAESQEIVEGNFPEGFFDKQPYMRGAAGHDGMIFMRTGPQLFYTTEGMREYGEIKMPLKFTDKWCRSFVDDMKGHYWIASERGLFCFDYTMQQMARFGQGSGLRGDFINSMELTDGRLWVATSQGLYTLDTDVARDSVYAKSRQKVTMYDIHYGEMILNNTQVFNVNEKHKLCIGWNFGSEMLQARVLLMDFAKQTGRLYEYSVDGGGWLLLQDDELMSLKGLWPGHHRLAVRLAGIEETAAAYDISVMPSFGFMMESLLLAGLLLALWLWYRVRGKAKSLLSERNEIEEALIEIEAEQQRIEEAQALAGIKQEESGQKYQRVKIDEQECADIVGRMKKHIEADKLYTNTDLKMKDLADMLHLSPSKLSQVFNLYLNENYYDFINRYRLNEFKRLIETGEYKRYTITALSERCGFKKSSFFSTFRKVEGMTPAEYLKNKGVKV